MSDFLNQFPYSDFHELNLDWLIKHTKELDSQIEILNEKMAEIEVLTEDQINQMINTAIINNNVDVYAAINQVKEELVNSLALLDADITARYKAYTDAQIALQKIYIDNQDMYYDSLAKDYADKAFNNAKDYTDSQVVDYTMMINPITGVYEDVRNVVNDIVSYFHTDGSLTAGEYDALELTATVYDAYELSAYDYDFNGKNLLV